MASAMEHSTVAPTSYAWDPLSGSSDSAPAISPAAMRRIQVDIKELRDSPIPGIFVVPDDDKVSRMHALITGPEETPYENGFFYFLIQFPHDYPLAPPQVRIMTTGGGTVRFNPNFYANGKVCLSILGTWSGPSWVATMHLSTVLLSIQSLMSPMPLHNEPGYESVCDDVSCMCAITYNQCTPRSSPTLGN
jgi:ubiquitin-conjugating enzyme E2 Z